MRKALLFILFAVQISAYAQFPELAKTPPMGWNSWNAFDLNINSKIVKAVADSVVSKGLAAAGYQYIVIDDGWQISRDENGRIIADSTRFPEGIRYIADYVHSKGLKFGIYTCCGTKTCGGRPGSYGYEAIDAKTYAEWGVDFIKEDWCYTNGLDTRTQYKIMSEAIKATGRHMLLSLCEWGVSSPWEWANGIGAMWRTTSDIQDCYDCVRNWGGMGWVPILEKNVNLAPFAGPGHWNDPDMMEVGNKSLTPVECRSHFSMWCMLAAPLIAGNNISTMNDTIRDIMTAPEIIAIDQDTLGIQGTRIRSDNGLQVWQKSLSDSSVAVALLNVTKSSASMFVTLDEIGFKKGETGSVRDLWKRKNLEAIIDTFKAEVEPHGVVVVKIKGKKAPVSILTFNQPSLELNQGNHRLIQLTVIPSVTPVTVTSSDPGILSLSIVGVNSYRLAARNTGNVELEASTSDGKLSSVCKVRIIPSDIPLPWRLDDIKDDKASANYDNGIFSIEGGGADIWSGSDQFAFLNREAGKDTYISARVISQTNSDPWAKTGLMFRESKAPNSRFVMISNTPVNGISLQWRDSTGGSCKKMDFSPMLLPAYFKLLKNGSTFTAYKSVDGNQWELLGDVKLSRPFSEKYLVGMEVLSHSSHMLNLSKFDQVKVEQFDTQKQKFQPSFESLEKANPVPEWFKDAKFGIYFHWGVYAVPAFANEWYPRNMYIKGSAENKHHLEIYGDITQWPYNNFITGATDKQGNYVQFAPKLTSEGGKFDPEEWAQLFADAGAKFAGPVAEHHDGFSMWASEVNPWNAKDMGPKLDLVGLLTDAIRKKNMRIILSMHHAYNITGFYDAVPQTNDPNLQMLYAQQGKEKNEAFWQNKHKEIIDNYKPDIIWQDFNLPVISQPVLLQFLSYYYNKAAEWNKEVVATYKDGLNTKCAVLDYERGGPVDITENYWLTDDAISSSSWCYTEGIGYYSKKQVLHGFLDRISKNGNLLLNISPKADGTIPQEQKDILLTMGSWLKINGEAVYSTRAWEKYGEGPTRMGAAHGVFTAPAEGTAKDIRYTRSKDNSTLYAILLGWDKGQKEVRLTSLSSDRIDLKNLRTLSLINGEAGKYMPLSFRQDAGGLTVSLPEGSYEDLAYVLKLSFDAKIPLLDQYADINSIPNYHLVPGDNGNHLVLGSDLTLSRLRKDIANQWKLESLGKGFYRILNRKDNKKALACNTSGTSEYELVISGISGKDDEIWKIENSFNGLYKIANKQYPSLVLTVSSPFAEGDQVGIAESGKGEYSGWNLKEVCELKQEAFKPNFIPGIIEVENFDIGCQEDACFDNDEINRGGQYRSDLPVDIDTCSAGGYCVGWTNSGEWMAYTVNVRKSSTYQVSFYIASPSDNAKLHLEVDGKDQTGSFSIPNTAGYQNWEVLKKTIKLDSGRHMLKLVVDSAGLNIDKMDFEEIK